MDEPGVGAGVQDETGQVVFLLPIAAPTGEDEAVRSEDGGMVIQGKGQGRDRAGASQNLNDRKEKPEVIIVVVVRIA